MYIDLVILVLLILFVIFFFKDFSCFVYFIALFDILLRIFTFIKLNIPLQDIAAVIDNYIPESIPSLLSQYISGLPYTLILWLYILIFIIFEVYIIKIFWKKKR